MTYTAATTDQRLTDDAPGGELNALIARAVVGLHRRRVGRGPTKAQAFFRRNFAVVVLQQVMTTTERSLVQKGSPEAVTRMRVELDAAMHDELVATVESITGAKVDTLLADFDVSSDTAGLVFVLDRPLPGSPPE